ncbi:alpha carbonic anhydrase, partial [Leptodontidium sp. 2 PMI_412]
WGYDATDGPVIWPHLDPSIYSLCGNGTHQSPIDLNDAFATTESSADYILNYPSLQNVPFIGIHQTVQAQVSLTNATNTLTFGGKTYNLTQFHFHVSSEHRIEGEYFPIEVHFVHSTTGGELAVIGFVIEVECTNDPLLGSVLSHIDELQGEDPKTILQDLDFSTITAQFAQNTIFRYSGSLTTPPCSEEVEWIVGTQPLMVDVLTFNKAKRHLKFNSRYSQDLPGRKNL